MAYDIFISYKRKSLATANNLYYRLTTRGYSVFFDLEEMGRDNFNVQLLNYIENAKDVFVLLEEGSLDSCKNEGWKEDWFCTEIAHAIKTKRNIIPILIGDYEMPKQDFFPKELKELSLKNAPEFSFTYFEAYLNKLIEKNYITSEALFNNRATSIFKFYSNSDCQVYKEGKLVCSLDSMSDEPYYLPVPRKGDYRFKCVNSITSESKMLREHIDADEEKDVDIQWNMHFMLNSNQVPLNDGVQLISGNTSKKARCIEGDVYTVELDNIKFDMIRVEGGQLEIGATKEQESYAASNEYPAHYINLSTFYIGKFQVTQNLWERVMGDNHSYNKDSAMMLSSSTSISQNAVMITLKSTALCPVENISLNDAKKFVNRLSELTKLNFDLPTEEEWEYAARGGQKSHHYRYAGSNRIDDVAWYRQNSDLKTHPVGEKQPNELGIYDMSGNVWEWTKSKANSYGSDISIDNNKYIRRGGSVFHVSKNCRVSFRYEKKRADSSPGSGLRVVIREGID